MKTSNRTQAQKAATKTMIAEGKKARTEKAVAASKAKTLAYKAAGGQIEAAVTKATASAIKMIRSHTLAAESKTPYRVLTTKRDVFAAWIIASAATAKIIDITAAGAVREKKGGSMALFYALIGSTARGHWAKTGRTDDSGMTVAGLNEFAARLQGTSKGYNTDIDTVRALVEAQAKGPERVEVKGLLFNMSGEIAVKA
jgi:hypothetical protein